MDPQEIIVQANAERERLEEENGDLRASLASYKSIMEEQTIKIHYSQQEIVSALAQRDDLSRHLAHMTLLMDEGVAASMAGAEILAQGIERKWSQRAQELVAETTRIQEETKAFASEAERHKKENVETITQLSAEVLRKTIELNESNLRLRAIDGDLETLTKSSETRASAQEELLRRLQESTRKQDKQAAKRTEKLANELAKAMAQVRENDSLKKDLYEKAKAEQQTQELLQKACDEAETVRSSLEFYRTADTKQMETIASYQRQLHKVMNEKVVDDMRNTIREKNTEIEKLTARNIEKETELKRMENLFQAAIDKLKEGGNKFKQKELETAGWKGDALGSSIRSLDARKIERFEVTREILDTIDDALKDINSERASQEALATIEGLLIQVEYRMSGHRRDLEATFGHIMGLIENIRELVRGTKTADDFKQLIDDIRGLQLRLKNSIEVEKMKKKAVGKKV